MRCRRYVLDGLKSAKGKGIRSSLPCFWVNVPDAIEELRTAGYKITEDQ